MEGLLNEYDREVYNEDKATKNKPNENEYDKNDIDEDTNHRERFEANYDKDDFDKYVYVQDSYDEGERDRDQKGEEMFKAPVRNPLLLDLFKIGNGLSKMRKRASSSLSICLLVSVWLILLSAVLQPVSAAPMLNLFKHMNHWRTGNLYHVRLKPSPISSLTTFSGGRPDSTPSAIAASYVQHTGMPSPEFMEYVATTKADHNPASSTPTDSLQPLHAGAKSHHKRDNSGLSTGALAGVVIGAIVVAALTFWICVWKCMPKMEQVIA